MGHKKEDTGKLVQGKPQIRERYRPPRLDAIEIKASIDDRYGGIINPMKIAPDLWALKERENYISRIRAGGVLLELGKPGVEIAKIQIPVMATR